MLMWHADSLDLHQQVYMNLHVHASLVIKSCIRCWWCCNHARFFFWFSVYALDIQMMLLQQVPLPGLVPSLARELEPFFWTRWPVLGLRPDLRTVAVTHLVIMTVPTLKMLESPANQFETTIEPLTSAAAALIDYYRILNILLLFCC